MDSANSIIVREDARELGVTAPVGCVISGLDVRSEAPELDSDVAAVESLAQERPEEILDSQIVDGSRKLYAEMGYSDIKPDGEMRFDLVRRRGLKRHNNVVDAYNIVGAEFGLGLGMHDTAQLGGDIVIERASGGERLIPLFRESYRSANPGDLLYGTRRHPLWISGQIGRDSDEFKVTESTDEALLMVVGNENTTESHNRAVCERTVELIQKTCPEATAEYLDVVDEALIIA
ncbi:phenylalanine--tRNA ligase beta subunit-related protein [Halocatena halophila]|uniref:phenylalanine--tRNA ligase beta subunit-related protein n=1 Tax=Halocatena halophila TaxID=2814576 RepID=UPI002ED3A9CA